METTFNDIFKNAKAKWTECFKWLIIAGLTFQIYYPTFVWMYDRWSARDSYYGHGFLIPLVTLFWLFKKKEKLAETPIQSDALGIPVLILGAALQLFSSFLRIYFVSAFSFIILLSGAIIALLGRRFFKEVAYPVFFLGLMVPLPLLAISQITLKMKFFVSEVSTFLLNYIGIKSVREGSYIFTPNAYLLVGDPCSGLRSFLAFLCLGFVFAYGGTLQLWKKVVLITAGLPLAILSNVLRVFSLGLLAELYGTDFIDGKVHDASGFVVFIIAFCCFMIIRRQLEVKSNG